MSYVDDVFKMTVERNPEEPEFIQAVKEVLDTLRPVIDKNEKKYKRDAILERLVEPERTVMFRVPWVDDHGASRATGQRFHGTGGPEEQAV